MNILRACFDWRVLAGLAASGIAIYLLAPGVIVAAIPLLLLAACPLSMLLMMKAMSGRQPAFELPPGRVDGDRVAALRQELADLSSRQEQLNLELRAVETSQRRVTEASDAPGPVSA
ncbi:MAG: DUF2933 domain-containing protein, partial [Chloroflexi bacterium]|nr:DUF2933 domain-containing protein [Chloroflexota bacterium]